LGLSRPALEARRRKHLKGVGTIADRSYKTVEISGISKQGTDDAISNTIAKASQSLRNLDWFEVTQIRGHIEDGSIGHYPVTLKLGFRLED
jgi:flavin-binding protein dodecin